MVITTTMMNLNNRQSTTWRPAGVQDQITSFGLASSRRVRHAATERRPGGRRSRGQPSRGKKPQRQGKKREQRENIVEAAGDGR
eukprot:2913615-Pleurochrysis_carterae.AAC.1